MARMTWRTDLPVVDLERVNRAPECADGLLRHDREPETLGDLGDLLRRHAGGELQHHLVRRKSRLAWRRQARAGRQRHDVHIDEPHSGRRAVAALLPLARLPVSADAAGVAAGAVAGHCRPVRR